MKRRTLQVTLRALEPSVVELTVGERVQLDRISESPLGVVADRHGALLEPGVNTLDLARGHYYFRTLSDANLHVVRGGVETDTNAQDKDGPLEPRKVGADGTPLPGAKGDETAGELPRLVIES